MKTEGNIVYERKKNGRKCKNIMGNARYFQYDKYLKVVAYGYKKRKKQCETIKTTA